MDLTSIFVFDLRKLELINVAVFDLYIIKPIHKKYP